MSSKNNLDTQNQYNTGSLNAYSAFQPQIQAAYTSMLQNPLASSAFNQQYNAALRNSQQGVLRNNANTLLNLRTGGGLLSRSGAYTSALLNKNMLAGSIGNSNAFNSTFGSALGNRNFALASMQGYQPLQIGQKSQSYQSGMGQYAQMAAGIGLNMVAPGLGSMMGGTGFKAGMKNAYGGSNGGAPLFSGSLY